MLLDVLSKVLGDFGASHFGATGLSEELAERVRDESRLGKATWFSLFTSSLLFLFLKSLYFSLVIFLKFLNSVY